MNLIYDTTLFGLDIGIRPAVLAFLGTTLLALLGRHGQKSVTI